MKKQFIVEMDSDKDYCDYLEHINGKKKYCGRDTECRYCDGEINDRPAWCNLVEHSIGECHIKYKELSNPYWEHKF